MVNLLLGAVRLNSCFPFLFFICNLGGEVAQSVERATRGEEVPGSIAALAARSLLVASLSV